MFSFYRTDFNLCILILNFLQIGNSPWKFLKYGLLTMLPILYYPCLLLACMFLKTRKENILYVRKSLNTIEEKAYRCMELSVLKLQN
jgi:hypothetical protein